MGSLRLPEDVKLIIGLLSRNAGIFIEVKNRLEKIFGRADYESDVLDFTHTGYYEEEMGSSLKRVFLGFARSIGPGDAYKTKLETNKLEQRFLEGARRTINIDPGYLDLAKLVLFSTKDYTHRIYLNKGIFAEVTLFYKDNSFQAWPWTYPDYKSAEYISIFNQIRERYKDEIRKGSR